MPRSLVLLWLLLFATPIHGFAATVSDEAAIRLVLGRFGAAIISRNRGAFADLALSDTISFASAVDSAVLARIRGRRPGATRYEIGSWLAFVDFIAASPVALEERFSNIVVRNDGTVASLWFDYAFVEHGAVSNQGHETWSLLNTAGGWKIASVTWSVSDRVPERSDHETVPAQ
jgi:hypothetical protein